MFKAEFLTFCEDHRIDPRSVASVARYNCHLVATGAQTWPTPSSPKGDDGRAHPSHDE